MNERIVKLFMESVDTNYIPLPIEDHIPSWTEKFAQLIVRECIEVVDNRSKKDFHPTSYGGELLHYVTTDLKQHFGVEE